MEDYKAFVAKARGMNGITFPVLGPDLPASGRRSAKSDGGVPWIWMVLGFFALSGLVRLLAGAG
jgi:hypothetical protein